MSLNSVKIRKTVISKLACVNDSCRIFDQLTVINPQGTQTDKETQIKELFQLNERIRIPWAAIF